MIVKYRTRLIGLLTTIYGVLELHRCFIIKKEINELGVLSVQCRANNAGWRIDYFIVSNRIKDKVNDVIIRNDVCGSDHCPVVIDVEI